MIEITKRFTFEAAHMLPWHGGKCKNLHGHSYKLEVSFGSQSLDEHDIVLDFDCMTEIVNDLVVTKYDHKYLNDFFENPTAEAMALDISRALSNVLKLNNLSTISVTKVQLWETEKCSVTITGLV